MTLKILFVLMAAAGGGGGAAAAIDGAVSTTTTAEPDNSVSAGGFRAANPPRRYLQLIDLTEDESMPLYEYNLVLKSSTPYSPAFDECLRFENDTSEEEFVWYGLRIQLPDDAKTGGGFWLSPVANLNQLEGVVQPYGVTMEDDEALTLYNFTFLSTQGQPFIRMNMQGELHWESFHFSFDDGNSEQETTKIFSGVNCVLEETESSTSYTSAVDPTLMISISQTQLREGTGKHASSKASTTPSIGSYENLLVLLLGLGSLILNKHGFH